jgi:hypothetical protein
MSLKTIAIDPQLLKISGKKKQKSARVLPSQLNINSNNIRQMLIEKLRKSRKTQRLPPKINTNSFDNHSNPSYLEPKLSSCDFEQPTPISLPVNTNKFPEPVIIENVTPPTIIHPDKPYGVLKNGTKPTYKTWNLSQKNYDSVRNDVQSEIRNDMNTVTEVVEKIVNPIISETTSIPESSISQPMIQEREIKKTYMIGKNKKARSVGVLIKNIHTRKKIEDDILKHKKTNITTVKNYLKSHNMIKHGTTAPTNLLRTMYENMKLCGDVANDNINNLIHNFEKD